MNESVRVGHAHTEFASLLPDNALNENYYFPSLVYSLMVPGARAINTHLIEAIYAERERDSVGLNRSNFPQLGGWHSHNFLHQEAAFEDIALYVHALGAVISEKLGYHPDYALRIGTMWSIINEKGCSNRAHIHPGSLWSGVYYVQAPEGSGNIEFVDPRTANVMKQATYRTDRKRPQSCWTKVNFTPIAGKMLMFPSWLYHAVTPNLSEAVGRASDRIIISFNLSQKKI